MQKKVQAFLIMSGVLMIGYLLAIAGPNPPWPVTDSISKPGTISDSKYGGTIWCNTYLAYNVAWIDQNTRNYRTYHWAYASKGTPGTSIYFKREWKHDPPVGQEPGNEILVDTTSPWESDQSYATEVNGPFPVGPQYPYTSLRPGEGTGEVKASLSGIYIY